MLEMKSKESIDPLLNGEGNVVRDDVWRRLTS